MQSSQTEKRDTPANHAEPAVVTSVTELLVDDVCRLIASCNDYPSCVESVCPKTDESLELSPLKFIHVQVSDG